jgi:hypothetical protein
LRLRDGGESGGVVRPGANRLASRPDQPRGTGTRLQVRNPVARPARRSYDWPVSNHAIAAFVFVIVAGGVSCDSVTTGQPDPEQDREQVLTLERNVALVLAKEGFDA